MRKLLAVLACTTLPAVSSGRASDDTLHEQTDRLAAEITEHGHAYEDLRELTAMGPRLAASPGAERALQWAKAKMEAYGFDKVTLMPTSVPYWTRGDVETASLSGAEGSTDLKVAALGGSVGTGAGGIEAPVVEVQGLDEVARLGNAVRGKIVFYNRAMNPNAADTFNEYGNTVDQRSAGPSQAARYGAVAVIVRSVSTLPDDDHPHTGMLSYRSDAPRVPAAAVSTHGANVLSQRLKADPSLKLRLELSAMPHGMAPSFNLVGEVTGSEKPNDIVLVGGHLDSWDLGPGAHDDGSGVVQSLEVVRALKALGLRPKRTIRCVLFMAEEEGGYGARDYATQSRQAGIHHIAAIESDRGGFAPVGFETDAGPEAAQKLQSYARLLETVHATDIVEGGSGTDVEPLASQGTVTIGYVPEGRHYFDLHHSALDQFSAIDKGELDGGAAAMAILAYALAQDGI